MSLPNRRRFFMEYNFDEVMATSALYYAIIMLFYEQKLLTSDELIDIRKELRKRGISLDNITLKSDVCVKEVL